MADALKALVAMRKLAIEMEKDLGIADLPEPQKLSYLAAIDLQDADGKLSSSELRDHPLVKDMARPTFFRSLVGLEEAGRLFRPKGVLRGSFSTKAIDAGS